MDLAALGWTPFFEEHFTDHATAGLIPARIAQEHKLVYTLFCLLGKLNARVQRKFQHEASGRTDFPPQF
jgi:hypothetical protein